MKICQNLFLLFVIICISKTCLAQNLTPELELASHWDGHSHEYQAPYNSLWGWTGSNGREYAIMGSLDSIYFFDVTNPYKIKLCDARAGRFNNCPNREFKTYKNYCYAVGDGTYSSLQIFDLSYLPDSVHKVYDEDTISSGSHSLFIDGERLYLSWNKMVHKGETDIPLTVVSLINPVAPTFIANLIAPKGGNGDAEFEYVHDLFVRNDTAYCCCGPGGLFIYNYKDPINPVLIQSITYYDNNPPSYTHSCWLSPDGNLLVFTDETQGEPVELYDVSALKDTGAQRKYLKPVCVFGSHVADRSTAHNAYMKGNLIYMSYYEDGAVVFDMSNVMIDSNVREIASYDTYPQNAPGQYHGNIGCWNVYPFFTSGTIIASDMRNGLFVLRLDSVSFLDSNYFTCDSLNINILQNPFHGNINLTASAVTPQNVNVGLYDMVGRKLYSSVYNCPIGTTSISIPCPEKLGGALILTVSSGNCHLTRKLVKMGD